MANKKPIPKTLLQKTTFVIRVIPKWKTRKLIQQVKWSELKTLPGQKWQKKRTYNNNCYKNEEELFAAAAQYRVYSRVLGKKWRKA